MGKWRSISFLVIALLFAAGVGTASAAVGDLGYEGCFSGETAVVACDPITGATADGDNSGLESVVSTETSPDGLSFYAAASGDDAIAHFRRSRNTGALTYVGCISGDSASAGACAQLPGATPGGNGSGLARAQDLTLSPDGESLYVTAREDDAVTHFRRDRSTGELTFAGCVSGNEQAVSCTRIAEATANGNESGLSGADRVEVSPDGGSLYVVTSDDGVARFSLDGDGTLTYKGCLGADTNAACQELPGAVPGGSDTGFSSLRALALSPDGRSLYTVSDSDESVAEFSLEEGTGALVYRRCLSGATTITNCAPVEGATPNGDATGLRSTVHVNVSPDGNSVYTVADDDNAVVHFDRAASGALTFRDCLSGDINATGCRPVPGAGPGSGSNSGMNAAVWVETAPDGRSVYVAASSDSAVNLFRRDPRTGSLTALGCLTVETEVTPCMMLATAAPAGTNTGLRGIRALSLAPGGASLYTTSSSDTAIARFSRERDRTGPKLTLRVRKRQRGKAVLLKVRCRDEFCRRMDARGSLRIGGRKVGLRQVSKTDLPATRQVRLKLRLPKAAKKRLKKSRRGRVKVVVVARDLLGNRTKRSAKVVLRR